MFKFISVALGGAIGSLARYLMGLIKINNSHEFPINTLIINVLGSFLIGFIAAMATKENANPNLILFLKVGLCGGFTTFSTFALESEGLISNGKYLEAFIYMILSFVLSLAVIFLSQYLVRT